MTDEFRRVPSILLEIKRIVDEKALSGEDNSDMFRLAGSQKFKMMQNVLESLAGRVAVFDMASLSNAEIEGREGHCFFPDLDVLKEIAKTTRKKGYS